MNVEIRYPIVGCMYVKLINRFETRTPVQHTNDTNTILSAGYFRTKLSRSSRAQLVVSGVFYGNHCYIRESVQETMTQWTQYVFIVVLELECNAIISRKRSGANGLNVYENRYPIRRSRLVVIRFTSYVYTFEHFTDVCLLLLFTYIYIYIHVFFMLWRNVIKKMLIVLMSKLKPKKL